MKVGLRDTRDENISTEEETVLLSDGNSDNRSDAQQGNLLWILTPVLMSLNSNMAAWNMAAFTAWKRSNSAVETREW